MKKRRCKATREDGERCRFFTKYGEYCHVPAHRIIGDPSWVRSVKLCPHRRKDGTTCKQPAGHDTNHTGIGCCKDHGGTAPNHIKAAQKEKLIEAVEIFGLPRHLPPEEVLAERSAKLQGHVDFFEAEVRKHEDPHDLVWGLTEKASGQGGPGGGGNGDGKEGGGGGPWHSKKFEAAPSVWLKLYGEFSDRLVHLNKFMVQANLAERKLAFDEGMAQLVIAAMLASFKKLPKGASETKIREVIGEQLLIEAEKVQ